MIQFLLLYSLSFTLLFNGNEAKIGPSYIKPCLDLQSDCLKNTIQEVLPLMTKGIPDLGIVPTDPYFESHLKLTLPGGFIIDMTNSTTTGLRKCIVDSATFKDKVADIRIHCNLTIRGQYKANGKILVVSINGAGDSKVKIKNAQLHTIMTMEDEVRDGITYIVLKDLKVDYTYGDKVTFNLENLFQGNPEISASVLKFLNENWKVVTEEFGKPIVDTMIDIMTKILTKFFKSIPKDELFAN